MADPIDLITLAQARAYLQKETGKTGQDDVIADAITEASQQIIDYVELELAPAVSSATRRFRLYPDAGGIIDLCPYVVRTVSSLTLHPESTSPSVLAASQFHLAPQEGFPPYGVYTKLELARTVSISSQTLRDFGYALADVAGAWGFASVPRSIQHWCKVTIWSWIRGDVQAFTTSYSSDNGRWSFPEELPRAVQKGLDRRWRRWGPIT